jgi:hypothetical protein
MQEQQSVAEFERKAMIRPDLSFLRCREMVLYFFIEQAFLITRSAYVLMMVGGPPTKLNNESIIRLKAVERGRFHRDDSTGKTSEKGLWMTVDRIARRTLTFKVFNIFHSKLRLC